MKNKSVKVRCNSVCIEDANIFYAFSFNQISNGTASYYLPNITAAPITNPLIEKEVYYGNVVRIKRLSMWQAIPNLRRDVKQYLRPNHVSRNVRVNVLQKLKLFI